MRHLVLSGPVRRAFVGKTIPVPSGSDTSSVRAPSLIRAAIALAAAAHVLYLSLLITCDILKIGPRGFVPRFEAGRVTVSNVEAGSVAAGLGLRDGDRITEANGQILHDATDWQRVSVHLDPSRPLLLEIDRHGQPVTVALPLSAGLREWARARQTPGVLTFRAAQFGALAFALLVAFKRSFQPSALLAALLLGSLATVSLALPMRLAVFWQALPGVLEAALWFPFTTSAAAGGLLFAFAAVFPRRIWPPAWIAVVLIPALLVVGLHLHWGLQVMRPPGAPTGLGNAAAAVFLVNFAYAASAVALLVLQLRAASSVTDRRRIRVLILGTATGAAAAIGVIVGYWRNPGSGIFETRAMTLLSLVFLAMPASFAYAILRHRLFDLRLIVRQGLRYALARRSVDALIPVLGALLVADVIVHRQEPLASLIEARWWWYLPIAGTLLVVRSRREEWLRRVDRRFFRERYDARRLLTSIAAQVERATSFETLAPTIVQQIDEALHPTFVNVLRHLPAASTFASDAGGSEAGPARLPTSLTVVGVLSVLRKPLALSLGDTAWVRHQLPRDERVLLIEHGIELLVPVFGSSLRELPLGLLVLGPRRSEEPYNQEDLDLLTTIAEAVGALMERSAHAERGLAECERCGRCYDGSAVGVGSDDGGRLRPSRGSLLINERYRLERRLGRGGMGTVYSATDTVLERPVAIKVIRDEATTPLDLDARFRREARAAASFSHPHVVRVYDFGVEHSGRPFLVMELLEGTTLRERLAADTRIERAEMLHILRGVCAALSAAHARDLVHRDLKPENIYLHQHATGVVPKVLDFGLAKMLQGDPPGTSTTAGTSAGLLIGTLEYMAPEQVVGDDVSPAWDFWALSVITYEMLTGRHPFRRGIVLSYGVNSHEFPTAEHVPPTALDPCVEAFFRRAFSRSPAERPGNAAEFLAALERVLA
jgi:hypothetical protein